MATRHLKVHPTKPERLLVLSDLHLGRTTTYAAPELLAPLVEGFDRVLLLGDIVDHWYLDTPEARKYERQLRAVCKAGGVKHVTFIHGNHDACANYGEEFVVLDGVLYLHGHAVYHRLPGDGCADARMRELNSRKFGQKRIASRSDRQIWNVVEKVYSSIPMALLCPIAWPWPVMRRIRALADEVAPAGAIHSVVLGHSHRPGVRHFQGLTLYNLGGWLPNTRAYGFVREGSHTRLIHIENRAKHLRWGNVLHQAELSAPVVHTKHAG